MYKLKKKLSFLLCAYLVLQILAFTGCSNSNSTSSVDSNNESESSSLSGESSDTESTQLMPELPEKDFGEYDFKS